MSHIERHKSTFMGEGSCSEMLSTCNRDDSRINRGKGTLLVARHSRERGKSLRGRFICWGQSKTSLGHHSKTLWPTSLSRTVVNGLVNSNSLTIKEQTQKWLPEHCELVQSPLYIPIDAK